MVKRISSTTHPLSQNSQMPQKNQSITNGTNGHHSNGYSIIENNVDVSGRHFSVGSNDKMVHLQNSYSNGLNNEKFAYSTDRRNSEQVKKELNLELINGMIGKLALSQQQQQTNISQQNSLNNLLNGSAKSVTREADELSER